MRRRQNTVEQAFAYYLEYVVKKTYQRRLLGSVVYFVAGLAIYFVATGLLFLIFYFALGIALDLDWWILLGSAAALNIILFAVSTITLQYLQGADYIDRRWGVLLFVFDTLNLGPRLWSDGLQQLRRARALRGFDVDDSAAVLRHMLRQTGKVLLADLREAVPVGGNPRAVLDRLMALDGVMLSTSQPHGLSLTSTFREELLDIARRAARA